MATILEPFYNQLISKFASRTFAYLSRKSVQDYETIYKTFMLQIGGSRITEISNTTKKIISSTILNNKDKGVPQISKAIRDRMSPEFTKARSATIARTETHTASSFAVQKQAEDMQAPNMKKRWVATTDDRSRSSHVAVNGQEVGIDEDFSVGGRRMSYAGDPKGGASNVVNCRCVIVYIEPEDIIFDEETTPTFIPKPQINVASTSMLDVVIDKSLTDVSVKILPLKESTLILNKVLKKANDDPRYINKDYGYYGSTLKADTFGEFDDPTKKINQKSASMLVSLLPELESLSKKFDVTMIRGITKLRAGRTWANMGDGVMGINANHINSRSINIGVKPKTLTPTVKKDILDLEEKINLSTQSLDSVLKKYDVMTFAVLRKLILKTKNPTLRTTMTKDYNNQININNARAKSQAELLTLKNAYGVKATPISQWKRGDRLNDRPHNSEDFWTSDIDRFRSTFYHEFGHHVHQTYKYKSIDATLKRPDYDDVKRPLEIRLNKSDVARTFKDNSPTIYGGKNTKEWFVENFSLFFMDKKDLVDPLFVKILKEMMNDEIF